MTYVKPAPFSYPFEGTVNYTSSGSDIFNGLRFENVLPSRYPTPVISNESNYPIDPPTELPTPCSNQMREIGNRLYNSKKCFVEPFCPPKNYCDFDLDFYAQWIGISPFKIDQFKNCDRYRTENQLYTRIYENPLLTNSRVYERGILSGKIPNFYNHLDAQQKLIQFLATDFRPRKGDPYTIPVSAPNQGLTLAEARIVEKLPSPQF